MATKLPDYTWERGYRALASPSSRDSNEGFGVDDYVAPPSVELVTSANHNEIGINVIRSWPTLYDGTNSPHGIPEWFQPQEKVDVLICGAGPSGLSLAASLARQGVSFRIIDKANGPLVVGRADGVQPRFLETAAKLGLADEIAEEGPLIDHTAIYKDGERMVFTRSHQSDSRYRGLHVITQGQIERIYIRDLLRHKVVVERSSLLSEFSVATSEDNAYPVSATIYNERTGEDKILQAKFLVGCDGGASRVRKGLNIPFDGCSTDIYWGVLDCIFESDYPHAWVFGMVMSSEHGCCAIIPREDGYIRLYVQLDISKTGPISASRQARDSNFAELGRTVEVHSITPEEVLEQANKIFAPFTLKFASSLSWFAIWRISERVARTYSSPDMRVHLVGDAAHIHSVLGAFGLSASMMDSANLSWKIGLVAKGYAKIETLLSTYTSERRKHAVRIIRVSGEYLRFICGSALSVPDLSNPEALDNIDRESHVADVHGSGRQTSKEIHGNQASEKGVRAEDLQFIRKFFAANSQFLLGVDCPYDESVIVPPATFSEQKGRPALRVLNGVRAPNPRVCFSTSETGYLYDKLIGTSLFHLVLFVSSLRGLEVRRQLGHFVKSVGMADGFYHRFGGARQFQVVVVVKLVPFEFEALSASEPDLLGPLLSLESTAVVFDDRAPDEDAHTTWGVNHVTGAVAVIRPDLWVGVTCHPEETEKIGSYFEGFLEVL